MHMAESECDAAAGSAIDGSVLQNAAVWRYVANILQCPERRSRGATSSKKKKQTHTHTHTNRC